MHAIRHHTFGGPEVLELEELPDLHPGADEVRIAVEAAGVHLLDTMLRQGRPGGPFPLLALPATPGREVAGIVDEVGAAVDGAWLGRRVVAHLGAASGGYASQAVVAATAVHTVSGSLDAAAAVALIGTGRTAIAVLDVATITDADIVVVTAAAGGLGCLFVQAGRRAGATVVGLAGGDAKVEQVAALGADVAVDYTQDGWPDRVRERLGERSPTLVLDGVGGELGRGAFDLLGAGGRIVMFGFASGAVTPFTSSDLVARSLSAAWSIGPAVIERAGGLAALERRAMEAAAAGWFVPVVGRPFPLAEAAAAHRAVESRDTVGKTVLVPSPSGVTPAAGSAGSAGPVAAGWDGDRSTASDRRSPPPGRS